MTIEPPSAEEQRRIIQSLEELEESSAHLYVVSKEWANQWHEYVGLNESHAPSSDQKPANLFMDQSDDKNNTLVDEKVWSKWAEWYGIAPEHGLDRRKLACEQREFEICILSPFSHLLEKPSKFLDVDEDVGYVELQLRHTFQVPSHRKSRLWVCSQSTKFKPLLSRTSSLSSCDQINDVEDSIIAIEIANPDESWPSLQPGEPIGSLDRYKPILGEFKWKEFWELELAKTLGTVFEGISNELKETAVGVVKTARCVTIHHEKDLKDKKEQITQTLKQVDSLQRTLNTKAKKLYKEEETLQTEHNKIKEEKTRLESERKKFLDEKQRVSELNKISEQRVKLDIGGHIYTTSVLTLTKDPHSMLAAMFSGRHSIKREEDGSYFIDRDGTHFRYILNYLRDGGFKDGTLTFDRALMSELLTKAEYYQLSGLVKYLTEHVHGTKATDGGQGHTVAPPERSSLMRRSSRRFSQRKFPPTKENVNQ